MLIKALVSLFNIAWMIVRDIWFVTVSWFELLITGCVIDCVVVNVVAIGVVVEIWLFIVEVDNIFETIVFELELTVHTPQLKSLLHCCVHVQ